MSESDEARLNFLCGGQFDPDFEYDMKRKELQQKDFRKNKNTYVDTNAEYRDFLNFSSTDEFKNTQKAKALLSTDWDTNTNDLRNTLQGTYRLSTEEVNNVFKNLSNSKDVETRTRKMFLCGEKFSSKQLVISN